MHSPYSFPEVTGKGFAVGKSKEVFIAVSAQLTDSTPKVESMSFERRKCLKRNEDLKVANVTLEAFQEYSRESCLLECRARVLFKECNCLPYYFPDFSAVWKKDTTCNQTSLQCLAKKTGESNLLVLKA